MRRIVLVLIIIAIPFIIGIYFKSYEKPDYPSYTIKVSIASSGEVKEMDLEEYLVGVVAGEMPIYFEDQALKAQAVVSRTYALRRIKKENVYDVVNTTTNQVYLTESELKTKWGNEYLTNLEKIKKIVNETKNECVFYNNQLIDALFFSTSPGITENSEDVFPNKIPYLRSVPSKWDVDSPYHGIKHEYDLSEFYDKLRLKYSENLDIEKQEVTAAGRIKKIKINGQLFSGSEILKAFKLESSYFTINKVGKKVIIESKGYGHNVGLSQYGANGMAKEGYSYREIIEHYYKGVEIKKI